MSTDKKVCLNTTGYEFIKINSPESIAVKYRRIFIKKNIFGTVYISVEGININLAGNEKDIKFIENFFINIIFLKNILFKHTYSDKPPFRKLKIKVKPEIISIKKRVNNIFNIKKNYIEPKELQDKLDNNENVYLLDTRNNYEINIELLKMQKI